MSSQDRLQEIREGFQPAFWVANVTELFERLAYYSQYTILANYLHGTLSFSVAQASDLTGYFGAVVWFLPILGGTLADRFGFRRSLAAAYLILALGYFLMGSLTAPWMAPLRDSIPLYWLVLIILTVPALGPAIVKPCVVGTTARASSENVRSMGYSIYYTLVNIGGMVGPLVAYFVHRRLGLENVFRVSSLFVLLMFFATLLFYKEPDRSASQQVASVAQALKNMLVVLLNFRFMLFLVIFSGFWVVFWQQFIALPLYITNYVNPNFRVEPLLSVDSATVILFTIVVNFVMRKVSTFAAMTLGILISGLSWIFLTLGTATWIFVVALVVLALGELIQSPRYYEYISRLAPPGQQGTYMGYSFLPIAIGSAIAGAIGGRLLHYFGEVRHQPQQMWWVISAVGVGTAVLMWFYNAIFKPGQEESRPA